MIIEYVMLGVRSCDWSEAEYKHAGLWRCTLNKTNLYPGAPVHACDVFLSSYHACTFLEYKMATRCRCRILLCSPCLPQASFMLF